MPRTATALVAAALLLAPATADAKLPALTAAPDPAGGGRIVDAAGREVLLRGAELTGRVNRRVLQATGWNVVRIRLDARSIAQAERLVDTLAEDGVYSVLAPPDATRGILGVAAAVDAFAGRPHVLGFEGLPSAGKLLFNPLVTTSPGLVYAPAVPSLEALGAARAAAGGAPVVVSWPLGPDAKARQDAHDGLLVGAIATGVGLIDPRGALARAYVRAAPGRIAFSHYDEARGHFAARGVAPRGNTTPLEVFYPGAKHREARFRSRGITGMRAVRTPGGGRLVYGVPRAGWSIQVGPGLR